ncbi:hypothetical protein [Pseudomonas sp. Leaf58]|uniref:hypothetical protein n=1 Tax=Pseudomonas sp. Leaf58 TaxID=1736226 RepID=UPI0006F731CB|nr:hypothetical protein [Pseudomonas sp. Leaf58]KQN61503.1 hypothetical protein ASF02_14115 [Pseudomonas sp. Leaf58]
MTIWQQEQPVRHVHGLISSFEQGKTGHRHTRYNTREHQWLDYLTKSQVAVFTHEYDALNHRIATTRPDGHRASWLTYGSGHLLAIKLDDQELISYERDDLHREIGRVQGNGLIQRQTWSPNGQLLEQTLARQGESKRIAARNYRYDEAGQLCHIKDLNRGDLRYRYDPVGRLIEASQNYEKETFAFDPASNLLAPEAPPAANPHSPRNLMDNVLRSFGMTSAATCWSELRTVIQASSLGTCMTGCGAMKMIDWLWSLAMTR